MPTTSTPIVHLNKLGKKPNMKMLCITKNTQSTLNQQLRIQSTIHLQARFTSAVYNTYELNILIDFTK